MKKNLLFICLVFVASVCNGQRVVNSFISFPVGTGLFGMDCDRKGNIYQAYWESNMIKRISPSGVVTIIAGTGIPGETGDGGPATAAEIHYPSYLTLDATGNIYFADYQHYLRKIDTFGIISTITGYDTAVAQLYGDGGPASAAFIYNISGIACDLAGNIYITGGGVGNNVRKIDPLGIITTVAGATSVSSFYDIPFGFSGDGGPATAALLYGTAGIAVDGSGNLYIGDAENARIRKVDAAGIITTIAGNGVTGYTGDDGPATAAAIGMCTSIKLDGAGNLLIAQPDQNVIRKINTGGVISTFAGTGAIGYSGDGGPVLDATFASPGIIGMNTTGVVYIADENNYAIRKVSSPDVVSDSFSIFIDNLCSTVQFSTVTNSPLPTSVRTYFGDGLVDTSSLIMGTHGVESTIVSHPYSAPGTYSVKEILLNGIMAIDSASFSYRYLLCNTFDVRLFFDANSNCVKDSTESANYLPVTIEVDSNSIAIDTISSTSGFYYTGYGVAGDVYSFKIVSMPPGLILTCAGSGIIYDTLNPILYNLSTNYIGFSCSSSPGFDLTENTSMTAGRHLGFGNITVNNNYCTPTDAIVTMNVDAKYVFAGSTPSPTSVVGNLVTWNFSGLSVSLPSQNIVYSLTIPTSTFLTPGDTVQTTVTISPISGDADTSNNISIRIDTVKSSYDPNEMSVTPGGYILPGTALQYTINFENTGNDIAQNIAVMDTLPDNVNAGSLRIISSSAVMETAIYNAGGHNIVKFDFPGINLLDSSHHNQCNGMVMFYVKTVDGLADGTTLFNHAGIFFDDNPVVMTDTVENIVSLIHGPAMVCVGSDITWSELANGGMWTSSNPSAAISEDTVSGIAAGIDTFTYTISSRYGNTFTTKTVIVNPISAVYAVAGGGSICAGAAGIDISLGGSDTGFVYQLYHGSSATGAAVTGTGSPLNMGVYTVAGTYFVGATSSSTSCSDNMSDSAVIAVNPVVIPLVSVTATSGDTVCVGTAVNFIATGINGGTAPVYDWYLNGTPVVGSTSYTYTPANNDVVTSVLISNALCAAPDSSVSSVIMTVDSALTPIVTISAAPGFTLAMGMPDTLTAVVSFGGAAPTYQWYVNGAAIGGATNATYISAFGNNDSVSCVVNASGLCGLSSFNSVRIHVSSTSVLHTAGNDNGIQIVPNPNMGTFAIQGTWGSDDTVEVEVTDMLGQVVYKNEAATSSGNVSMHISVGRNLANGMYLLNLKGASGTKVLHFILER